MNLDRDKKIARATPKKRRNTRYAKPLAALRRKPAELSKLAGATKRSSQQRDEAEQVFYSIRWDKAWEDFVARDESGQFNYASARGLAFALAVGANRDERKRRANYLYSAIGPIEASDEKKRVPYLGDWEMLRSQTFLGEMKRDSLLFGSPTMKTARAAMRKHVDVMETAKACAETMLSWIARYEMWSRQVDEHFAYTAVDAKLTVKENLKRFEEYTKLQRALHAWQAEAVEHVLRCYGVGKDETSVLLQQMVVAAMKPSLGDDAVRLILAATSGVELPALPPAGVESQPTNGHSRDSFDTNPTLKLIMGSFLEKSAIYKMPDPDVSIEGVPDEEEQATPRGEVRKAVRDLLPEGGGKKVQ